jgi:hypothetical protein
MHVNFVFLSCDHSVDFLVACREHLNWITEPEYAEALALRRAIVLVNEERFDRVDFASDCLSLV